MNQKKEDKKQNKQFSTDKIGGNEQEFKELQEFSGELIKLGQQIGEKFQEKQKVKQEIVEKEKEAHILQTEIFGLKDKLMQLNLELSKLESRRKQLEGA